MDEFGVLVESIGFKSQTRSTPLSKLKSEPTKQNYQNAPPPPPPPPSSTHQNTGGFDFGHQDFMFHSNQNTNQFGAGNGVDLDAFFVGGSGASASASASDDIFGLNAINNSGTNNGHGFGDLLSGFANPTTIGGNSVKGNSGQSSFAEDPLSFFESPASRAVEYSGKKSSPIDQLEAFAMGSSQNNGSQRLDVKISNEAITRVQEKLSNLKPLGKEGNATSHANIKVTIARKGERDAKVTPGSQPFSQREKLSVRGHSNEAKSTYASEDSFGSWFSNDSQTNSSRRPKSEIKDPVVGSLFSGRNQSNVENPSSQSLQGTKKAPTNRVDDFMFFGEPAPSAVEFFEIEGEPEERRRARFNQHMRTKERMAKALSEKNQRDLQAQHEQEQRHSLAESMDNNIKRWSAGKVGNLRALLSSLQDVLWPECGWQPVSLTDMITSVSVKKVYHKATLCVHPDKVQQKGATVQQKYIAEKVFDLLKEAWNKFNAEELR